MKKILFLFAMGFIAPLAAQQIPLFETTIYVKDAMGNIDSVQIGFDPEAELVDTVFGSVMDNSALDSILDIRVSYAFYDAPLFKRLILRSESIDSCELGIFDFFAIWSKYQPVTLYWNKSVYQEECYDEGFFSPDYSSFAVEPWIWAANPNITMACASKSDSLSINLLTEPYPYPDGSGGFYPILTYLYVEGLGIQPVAEVHHHIPYYPIFSPCWTVSTSSTPIAPEHGSLQVFPNPGNGHFSLRNTRLPGVTGIRVFNLSGGLVSISDNVSENLDLSQNTPGIYFLSVEWEDGYRQVQKLVVAR